jgi:hypothetical protein
MLELRVPILTSPQRLLRAESEAWEEGYYAYKAAQRATDNFSHERKVERVLRNHNRYTELEKLKLCPADPVLEEIKQQYPNADHNGIEGILRAILTLRQTIGENSNLSNIRILDLFSGSAVVGGSYSSNDHLQRFAPWFSRTAAHLGADVTAVDIRPQADGEPFQHLVYDLKSPNQTRTLLSTLGDFDVIHVSGFHYLVPNRFLARWQHAMRAVMVKHVRAGGALFWCDSITRVMR